MVNPEPHPVQQSHPCDDCGGTVVVGAEPVDHSYDEYGLGADLQLVDFCTNLACPSNHAIRGLKRLDVNAYVCATCSGVLTGPIRDILDHLRSH